MTIEAIQRTVYRSPSAGRCFLTKRAAIMAEARALIMRKHPTERPYTEPDGYMSDPGWRWTAIPRCDVLYRRVARLVAKSCSKEQP